MNHTAFEVRQHLIRALQAELVGPFDLDNPQAEERLHLPPSRWYLTGYLAPEQDENRDDPTDDEQTPEAGGVLEGEETGNGENPEPKAKKRLPASIGLSVLLPASATSVTATITYADYEDERLKKNEGRGSRRVWLRHPRPPKIVQVPLNARKLKSGIAVPDTGGVVLVGRLDATQVDGETVQALSLFVVNRRPPADKTRKDAAYLFQVGLELECSDGIVPRKNRAHEAADGDWDERLADLQYRHHSEWAVGHGVAIAAPSQTPVTRVATTWFPGAEIKPVVTHHDGRVVTEMLALAGLATAEAIDQALGPLPGIYAEWIAQQAQSPVDSPKRGESLQVAMQKCQRAKERIARGIARLQSDPIARRAFCLANQAMNDQAEKRLVLAAGDKPKWRLFQLAFLLLNIEGIADESHADRETVELIFFPTGGGKTEAYLGVIAFTLFLRRLRGQSAAHGGLGVAVVLRYTLRLLTLDQLSRAATLICAMELLRRQQPQELGEQRFAVGLWVGKSATANTMEEVREAVNAYKNSTAKNAISPFPLTECPWCARELQKDRIELVPADQPNKVIVGCDFRCEFSAGKHPDGLPVLFVDEQIYRELPCFLVATVDKFAMLPWRGETGMLFGRVRGRKGDGFVGFMSPGLKPDKALPEGLLPPELIVQDELHLISGPLGTMVGLFESAVELLCTRMQGSQSIRPKIIASTATVRRARSQIKALFARGSTEVFPPAGVDPWETFFARVDTQADGRLYVGVAAPGQSMKRLLLTTYVSLLAAANRYFDLQGMPDQSADGYMTLAGYFNSLRELGGMRRLVEDEVRTRARKAHLRQPESHAGEHPWYVSREVQAEPLELTSREHTQRIKESKSRLEKPYQEGRVDVLLASNMISVGVDINRLGLMVVAGQPKTSSEYIQATSRVGRDRRWPGLVVTCFNVHKPRDRSHYERFTAYHQSFYRYVEAMSLTPFSAPALDRGLAGVLVAMARHYDGGLTPPKATMDIGAERPRIEAALAQFKERIAAQLDGEASPLADEVAKRAQALLDAWETVVKQAKDGAGEIGYSRFDRPKVQQNLLRLALDEVDDLSSEQRMFAAPTSMRDVEPNVHLWLRRGKLAGGPHA